MIVLTEQYSHCQFKNVFNVEVVKNPFVQTALIVKPLLSINSKILLLTA